ncbi:hypothetical protein BU24DRAFT_415843 [Aaosphaeria arxii CBS 175.79]|uniref:Uncharacterized protein n=1 Tax=Aaosphaeria arxii CBS 175.79 TaxID=1450172 RepID=A0A6A5X6S3_9PLEO|nr:uncharacterized protein BU24DRAFT_415843 [Aaosphaeria arxii CBS 175.79]KAF2008484.1 hypothetical protein BU24DRAFT_415843 [Aaosphaeria arxii CBS 175.79]
MRKTKRPNGPTFIRLKLEQWEHDDKSWKDKIKKIIRDFTLPAKWTVAAIIAPESLVRFAFSDWMHVKRTESLLKMYGRGKLQSWDRTHIHYANMGGFVFQFEVLENDSEQEKGYDQETKNVALDISDEFHRGGYALFIRAIQKRFRFILSNFRKASDAVSSPDRSGRGASHNLPDRMHELGDSSAIELRSSQGLEITDLSMPSFPEAETEAVTPENPVPSPTSNASTDGDVGQIPTKKVDFYLNGT